MYTEGTKHASGSLTNVRLQRRADRL